MRLSSAVELKIIFASLVSMYHVVARRLPIQLSHVTELEPLSAISLDHYKLARCRQRNGG